MLGATTVAPADVGLNLDDKVNQEREKKCNAVICEKDIKVTKSQEVSDVTNFNSNSHHIFLKQNQKFWKKVKYLQILQFLCIISTDTNFDYTKYAQYNLRVLYHHHICNCYHMKTVSHRICRCCTKFHMSRSHGSLVITIKPKFHMASMLLLYILSKRLP
jgi:hypothetical protein